MLECEPLHNLKELLKNLFEILPEILDKGISLEVSEEENKTGADYGLASVHGTGTTKKANCTPAHGEAA